MIIATQFEDVRLRYTGEILHTAIVYRLKPVIVQYISFLRHTHTDQKVTI